MSVGGAGGAESTGWRVGGVSFRLGLWRGGWTNRWEKLGKRQRLYLLTSNNDAYSYWRAFID